jgi:hypothetical protein
MCATSGERNVEPKKAFALNVYTMYISKSNCNQMCIIHKWKRSIYVDKRVLSAWGNQKKENAPVLEDVTSFLSNSTGPSNNSQQWGLKSPGRDTSEG